MDISPYIDNIPEKFNQFSQDLVRDCPVKLTGVQVVGSVLTPDYLPGRSDINSVLVVEEKNTALLDFLIELGKRFRKHRVAPPLIMTPAYIETSLDAFPLEFLNFQLIHHPLHGPDLFAPLTISGDHLRLQCERELKAKLLWLGQIYIETLGDQRQLAERLGRSFSGYLPLFRGILHLHDRHPLAAADVIKEIGRIAGLESDILIRVHRLKTGSTQKVDGDELKDWFEQYSRVTEALADHVDTLTM